MNLSALSVVSGSPQCVNRLTVRDLRGGGELESYRGGHG